LAVEPPVTYSVALHAALGMIAGPRPLDVRHPDLLTLLAQWNFACDGRRIPCRRDLDIIRLKPWIGHLAMLEVIEGGQAFLYRVYGSDMAALMGRDLTGKTTDVLPPHARDVVLAEYRGVVETAAPDYIEHVRTLAEGERQQLCKLILPLGKDGVVDRLLVGIYPSRR
jgi:hypothetical protein